MAETGVAGAPAVSWRQDVRVVGLITAGHFMSHFYQLVIPPVLTATAAAYGANYTQMGLVMLAFSAATGAVQTPIGFLVDRIGARMILIVGLAMLAGSVAAYAFAPSWEWLMLLALLGGCANAVFHPADFSILAASVHPGRLGRAFSFHAVSGNLGWAAVPVVMAGLEGLIGVRQAFLLVGLVGVGLAFLLWTQSTILREEDERAGHGKAGGKPAQAGSSGLALLLSWPVLSLFFFQMIYAMAFGGVRNGAVTSFEKMFHMATEVAATALTAYLIGASFGSLIGGWLVDRVGKPLAVFTTCISATTVLIVLIGALAMPPALLTVVMALTGTLQGCLQPSRDILVRKISPPGQMGKVFGFTSTGLSLGSAAVPVAVGWVLDHGDPHWIFWGSAVFMALCMLTFSKATEGARAR